MSGPTRQTPRTPRRAKPPKHKGYSDRSTGRGQYKSSFQESSEKVDRTSFASIPFVALPASEVVLPDSWAECCGKKGTPSPDRPTRGPSICPSDPNWGVGTRPIGGAVIYGAWAMSVGKPSPIMMRAARKELGLATSRTVMVGDTMETDILGGVQMGYRTILVLSGSTRRADVTRHPYRPDLVLASVAELADPSVDLQEVVPWGDCADDSVHDLKQWKRAAV